MTETATALYSFFSGFGIPAYLSDNIPDNVVMPYITYDLVDPPPLSREMLNASVWYRDSSVMAVSAKADEIKAAIGTGRSLKTASGSVILKSGNPFCQLRNDPNRETKRAYLTMYLISNTN